MDVADMKHMASNFTKLDKFKGIKVMMQPWNKSGKEKSETMMTMSAEVSCIIDKLPPFWNDFKHTLKHLKEELTLVELGSHLRIEESLRVQDSDKPKGNNVAGPSVVNMVEHTTLPGTMTTRVNVNIMITEGLILTRRQNLLDGNVAKLVTLKGIVKVLMLATKPMVQTQKGSMDGSSNSLKESIMGNNTWVLVDLPPGYKPLGCKWIFKVKLTVDGTIEKFKARLVIQGFKQKSRIEYFYTYSLVVRISTIRLLIAMALIHNLIIHQMDVKTAFLNGDLDEEVNLTKEILSSRFSMKDIRDVDLVKKCKSRLILGTRIKHESNGISIFQSHYIEKVLKKFSYFDCTLESTPIDTSEKLMLNNGQAVS
uniref:Zinc finger, CCHC-type n=1 Tax=Tanacetum cinerariifolium TaxID=118510 RepID=A0A6L2J4X6_TANCI|nr:zinc finger, CCHC-type [Tanacetum cinerariifolium]